MLALLPRCGAQRSSNGVVRIITRSFASSAALCEAHPPIRALIIGSPGSGKGTLSKRLLAALPSLQYLSAGDMLRNERARGTELGKAADKVMRSGTLMPDDVMMRIVDAQVQGLGGDGSASASWLLDGFPRTRPQAQLFDAALQARRQALSIVLHLDVPNEVIISRIEDRWIHAPSGRTYNLSYNPPKVAGKDDETGEALSKRVDDDADIVKARLRSYDKDTYPMVEYYSQRSNDSADDEPVYVRLQGTTSDEIWPRMLDIVKRRFGDAVKG